MSERKVISMGNVTENELKKEYLREYRQHVRRISRIEAELSELRAMKTAISVNNDGMPPWIRPERHVGLCC